MVQAPNESLRVPILNEKQIRAGEIWHPGTSTKWMVEPWENSDSSYLEIRQKIDILSQKDKVAAKELYRKYDVLRKKNPRSSFCVFAWAWSYIRCYPEAEFKQVGEVARVVENTPSPKNREFTRLRFIIEPWKHSGFQRNQLEMGKLGERLIRSDDNETYFIYRNVSTYYISAAPKSHQYFSDAIRIAKAAMNKFPNIINAYGGYADCFYVRWLWTKNKTNLDESLKYYNICLNSKNINLLDKEWLDSVKKDRIPDIQKALRSP